MRIRCSCIRACGGFLGRAVGTRPWPPSGVSMLASFGRPFRETFGALGDDSYLVDSASSHMLVSKIKPCMSKYKQSIR